MSSFHSTAPRSSMAWKHHIDIGAGVIDADYRGNVGVVLFNLSKKTYEGIYNMCEFVYTALSTLILFP